MKLFICKITDKEIFTDASRFELIDDTYYLVKGKIEASSDEVDESCFGGNKSAEAEDEGVEANVAFVSSLVSSCKLQQSTLINNKKDFKKYFSQYCKKIVEILKKENPERVDLVKASMQKMAATMLANYDVFQWFAAEGDEYDCEGAPIPHKTINSDEKKGDQVGDACEMIVWKDGVREEKC